MYKRQIQHDAFGYRHFGLLNLSELNKAQTKFYVQPGRFLDGKVCVDCHVAINQLLPHAGNDVVLYHCNNNLTAYDLDTGDKKTYLACGTKLCVGCYAQRLEKLNTIGGNATGRSRRCRD